MRANFLKWASLGIMLVQNAATPIIFRLTMTESNEEDRFNGIVAVTTQEILKLLMSMVLLFGEEQFSIISWIEKILNEVVQKPKDTLRLAIPAILYFIQNIALQKAGANLPAAVFQVTYEGKSLVVALFSVMLLQKKLNRSKWLAITIMGLGLVIFQLFKGSESKQSTMGNANEQNMSIGLVYVILGCFCSGGASVYFEKMMKVPTAQNGLKPSMWIRNIQLAGFSTAIGALQILLSLLSSSSSSLPQSGSGIFNGFSTKV